ncbi:MAG TPA: transketolase [Candidatus Saccharimonadales bacterium]|nr:transketolase [Candidatus Saccharimonadales bacterium]
MNANQQAADTIRILSTAMVEKANSGHPGGPMGAADFIHVLFSEFMVEDPDDGKWPWRDRFFLDAGHMSPMLYSILALTGRMPMEEIKNFRQWGSKTPGHPERDLEHGIENTSGPLGQGHVFGVGAAIAAKFLQARFGDWQEHKIYCFISDGGIQEEISQGAGRIAGNLGLNNLIMFYDSNQIQLSTETDVVTHEDTAKKYEAWGWSVITIDGNDQAEIRDALKKAGAEKSKPTLIIGNTVMGKGAVTEDGESFEHQVSMHGQPITGAGGSYEKTIKNIGGDPKDPFVIPEPVKELYKQSADRKRQQVTDRKNAEADWRAKNAKQAEELDLYLSGQAPKLDWADIAKEQKPDIATRASSSFVLGKFAENVGNMIVMSADLANSDKTDGFLKKSKAIERRDFSGAFLHCGVSEFSMAAIAIGMGLHGGVIPVCGTFFAFSDYMKPALRLAALMEVPVKFLWTHDAFRVGEDGPTHQPIEQEAQLRLLEKVHNHSHKPGFLVLRPADSAETTVAWQLALENTQTPTGLILTRQGVKDVSDYGQALSSAKGAYVAYEPKGDPELVIVANGSEVGTAYETIQLLPDKNIRLVSVPSEGLFREQPREYQDKILPPDVPRFGVTAGLAVNLLGLVGDIERIHSLEHFGFSAPYKKLDEEFGFTPEKLSAKIRKFL